MSLQYLFSLIIWHYGNNLSVFFIDRLLSYLNELEEVLHPADSIMFCFKCRLIMVPVVNSTVRVRNLVFSVVCKTCKKEKNFKIPSTYTHKYIKESCDINEFLAGY